MEITVVALVTARARGRGGRHGNPAFDPDDPIRT
jgi:hypothetical protein